MNKLDSYIYHKIAISAHTLYEMYNKNMKSKGRSNGIGFSFYDFCRYVTMDVKNAALVAFPDKNHEKFIKPIMSIAINDIEDIYGINGDKVGIMVFDFFYDEMWVEFVPIVIGTRKYFGV